MKRVWRDPFWFQVTYQLAAQHANLLDDPSLPPARRQDIAEKGEQVAKELLVASGTLLKSRWPLWHLVPRRLGSVPQLYSFVAATVEPSAALLLAEFRSRRAQPHDVTPALWYSRRLLLRRLDREPHAMVTSTWLVRYARSRWRSSYRADYNFACWYASTGGDREQAVLCLEQSFRNAPKPAVIALAAMCKHDASLKSIQKDERVRRLASLAVAPPKPKTTRAAPVKPPPKPAPKRRRPGGLP